MKLALCLVLALAGCGVRTKVSLDDDDDDGPDLDAIPVSVSPPGGTYSYRPWVTVTKESSEDGTGSLRLKGPGDEGFRGGILGVGCGDPFRIRDPEDKRQSGCVEIERSGDLEYYLDLWFDEDSAMRWETYVIELAQLDLGVYTELDTVCSVYADDKGDPALRVLISLKDAEQTPRDVDSRDCPISIETYEKGGLAKGRFTCPDLAGPWQCDGWR